MKGFRVVVTALVLVLSMVGPEIRDGHAASAEAVLPLERAPAAAPNIVLVLLDHLPGSTDPGR